MRHGPGGRKAPAESCHHAELETLGNDTDAEFARCHACGQVVVFRGGQTWAICPIHGRTISIH